jgi:hypothetical protein
MVGKRNSRPSAHVRPLWVIFDVAPVAVFCSSQ